MSSVKKIICFAVFSSFISAAVIAREAPKPQIDTSTKSPSMIFQRHKIPTIPSGKGGDENAATAAYCAAAYQEMANAVSRDSNKAIIRFWHVGVSGETGRISQELFCYLPDASEAIDNSTLIRDSRGYPTNLGSCIDGYKDSGWRSSCFDPRRIVDLKNEKKEALRNAGWNDSKAIDRNDTNNQPTSLNYGGFTYLSSEVPYILFDRFNSGDVMLLRAIAGYENIMTLMYSGERTWTCIASNVGDFANRCR